MNISDKYIETLKAINGWTTVSNWAIRFGEMFPELLEKANREAINQKKPSTGLREIAARISSNISRGAFTGLVEIDESERPRKIRILNESEMEILVQTEIDEDTEPLTRDQLIKNDLKNLNTQDQYRLDEMQAVSVALNSYFRLDFEVDHAMALLNPDRQGKHHPNNLQLLLKSHNRIKSKNNWERFTFDEQVDYIQSAIKIQKMIAKKMDVDLDGKVIDAIISRLKLVY